MDQISTYAGKSCLLNIGQIRAEDGGCLAQTDVRQIFKISLRKLIFDHRTYAISNVRWAVYINIIGEGPIWKRQAYAFDRKFLTNWTRTTDSLYKLLSLQIDSLYKLCRGCSTTPTQQYIIPENNKIVCMYGLKLKTMSSSYVMWIGKLTKTPRTRFLNLMFSLTWGV